MEVLIDTENDSLNQAEEAEAVLTDNPKPRLTLRDAVRLCGMSEKTLRRKLEAGLLDGFRENLDYGGFMWMIDARSLADLYPDSAQLRDYIRLLENQLNHRPAPEPAPSRNSAAEPASESRPAGEQKQAPPPKAEEGRRAENGSRKEEDPKSRSGNDFVIYLLEENRCLKEDVREKEVRLRQLHDRTMMLERECGEQRGTASTQARVLEWFQQQPQARSQGQGQAQAALPAPRDYIPAPTQEDQPTSKPMRPALLGALAATLLTWLVLGVIHLMSR